MISACCQRGGRPGGRTRRRDRHDRRLRHGRPADGADRRAARTGRQGPRHHQQQRRQRHRRPGRAAGREPRAQDHLLVPEAGGLADLRRPVPQRQDRAGAGAAGQPGRTHPRRRRRHRRLLHAHGLRHAAGRGQGNPRNQRPPVRAGIPAARRLRADQGRARRPLGQPGVPQDRAQLRPHHGQRGARGRGAGARDRRTGRARSRERGHPGIFVQRVVRIDAAPAAKEQQ